MRERLRDPHFVYKIVLERITRVISRRESLSALDFFSQCFIVQLASLGFGAIWNDHSRVSGNHDIKIEP